MTKEEATCLVDALIDATELACVTDNENGVMKAQALRDSLRGYVVSMLVASGYTFNTYTNTVPGVAYTYRDSSMPKVEKTRITCDEEAW